MSLERLHQIYGGRRRQPTPREVGIAIGKEKIRTMDEGLRRYPVTEDVKKQKKLGLRKYYNKS